METIKILGGIIFVKNDEDSDNMIEVFNAEHNCINYRLKIDKTTFAPYYELYRDRRENKRNLTDNIYNSSNIEKVSGWIRDNIA